MGILRFVPSKFITDHGLDGVLEKVHVINWRGVADSYLGLPLDPLYPPVNSKEEGLEIVLPDYRVIFVAGLTLDRLNEINREKLMLEYPFFYRNSKLGCLKCYGSGQVDWIEKTTDRPKEAPWPRGIGRRGNRFIRNPKGVIHQIADDELRSNRFFATCKVKKAHYLCPVCKGSGLHFMHKAKITKTFFLDGE